MNDSHIHTWACILQIPPELVGSAANRKGFTMPENTSNLVTTSKDFLPFSILTEISSIKSQLEGIQNEISRTEDYLFDIEETLKNYRTEESRLSTRLDTLNKLEEHINPAFKLAFVAFDTAKTKIKEGNSKE